MVNKKSDNTHPIKHVVNNILMNKWFISEVYLLN